MTGRSTDCAGLASRALGAPYDGYTYNGLTNRGLSDCHIVVVCLSVRTANYTRICWTNAAFDTLLDTNYEPYSTTYSGCGVPTLGVGFVVDLFEMSTIWRAPSYAGNAAVNIYVRQACFAVVQIVLLVVTPTLSTGTRHLESGRSCTTSIAP